MKLTKTQLKRIIKEELEVTLTNDEAGEMFGEEIQRQLEGHEAREGDPTGQAIKQLTGQAIKQLQLVAQALDDNEAYQEGIEFDGPHPHLVATINWVLDAAGVTFNDLRESKRKQSGLETVMGTLSGVEHRAPEPGDLGGIPFLKELKRIIKEELTKVTEGSDEDGAIEAFNNYVVDNSLSRRTKASNLATFARFNPSYLESLPAIAAHYGLYKEDILGSARSLHGATGVLVAILKDALVDYEYPDPGERERLFKSLMEEKETWVLERSGVTFAKAFVIGGSPSNPEFGSLKKATEFKSKTSAKSFANKSDIHVSVKNKESFPK